MSSSNIVKVFLILGLLFSSIGGLVVASILKKLDNVVKVNICIILTQIYMDSKNSYLKKFLKPYLNINIMTNPKELESKNSSL